ncbi:transposase [Cohnella silvisoli]|uniref:IS1595 family transposase n=1 Tax=Cohnella silvisoli TaxID=2873699 RepID=A0ABV1L3E1_9BACL|nr:transposase [Cohnella silvisoli]MCD9026110.1 transposase [Cohnella silvisoli]
MISVRQFMARFPDEQACRDYLFNIRWPRGFICTKCGEHKHSYIKTRNLFECAICKTQTSITSGTAMHRTKLPLRYWLLTFYWVASGERISARKISIILKLQYRTALKLLHAVRYAMHKADTNWLSAFWLPAKPTDHSIVRKAKLGLLKQADHFIRKFYGHISEKYRYHYFSEYWFRSNNAFNPDGALHKLITSGSMTNYSINEYRWTCSHA